MEKEEVSKRINQILSKFDNGVELYQTNAVFANCVEGLLRGGDVYKMLEQVVLMNTDVQNKYLELIKSGKIRQEIIVSKERFEELTKKQK